MTFDRRSQFDRSYFDRFSGVSLPARIAGRFAIVERTRAFTMGFRTNPFAVAERTNAFTVVAYK